uniref:Tim44-like domain-containing protein n=1 Tax=Entomoneis paludosa TaxID=265537 RepID=A0A7S2YSU1_9STRA|mmetsp:Transcript_8492/g.17629  ORF Transcript_8492/g.17629 Transcript_8492/m.17629 type:complete len:405 (+) Transcript_8492:125-1339(+)|eukprot:CAMPEP_0172457164 /NCGR_PEP_ID=MMETSP1065-20121228/20469_1 /TAXON_ID=265537 /ORGANISM="Amphiprora paludosa, Strain CCMP125" /LENGTH=404 /DNA_ID=CAMNT_0013210719 /DNA_START=73 /DNA_END=1287 /DNA_ORIENTATION=+
MASRMITSRLTQSLIRRSQATAGWSTRSVPVPSSTTSIMRSSLSCPTNRLFSSEPSDKKTTMEETKIESEKNSSSGTTKNEEKPAGESFQDTVNRLRGDSSEDAATEFSRRMSGFWSSMTDEVQLAWKELVNSEQRKSINKKIHPTATTAGDAPYTGPVDIMVIDESENLTAWERMQKRLTDAPIIQDMLNRSEELYETTGARKAKERVDEIKEDAREAWETSQNPWVYRVSSVYDTLTAESAETLAVKELRELDPEFTLDDWRRDVVEHTLPQIMEWFLEGRINQLKDWLADGVFKRVAAEITARKKEGFEIDTHVLGIMNSEILAVEPDTLEKGSPIIMLHFMVQQINCVRKKEDGTVVEGSEDDIRANSYVAAFQREYREEEGELVWKIVDFRFNGAIAYL